MNEFIVYIIKSHSSGKYYYGYTSNLNKRLEEHNNGISTYTRKYIPWELIYTEKFSSRLEAMKREKFFKSYDGYKWLKENKIIWLLPFYLKVF